MPAKYLAFDNETGGIGIDKSLLTSYLAVLDENFNMLGELDLLMKPEDGVYRVNAEALGINKIDLIAHDKVAVTYKQAGSLLFNFLKEYSVDGKIKLTPLGHNVESDKDHIWEYLLSKLTWNKFCSYRNRDTGVIGGYLIDQGKIPNTVSGSLGSYIKYFGIGIDPKDLHTSRGDTWGTIEVYKHMLKL